MDKPKKLPPLNAVQKRELRTMFQQELKELKDGMRMVKNELRRLIKELQANNITK